jgi:hypothetical protein
LCFCSADARKQRNRLCPFVVAQPAGEIQNRQGEWGTGAARSGVALQLRDAGVGRVVDEFVSFFALPARPSRTLTLLPILVSVWDVEP